MLTALNTLPLQKEFTDRAPKRKSERLSLGKRLASREQDQPQPIKKK
jgi:hypothetical protein